MKSSPSLVVMAAIILSPWSLFFLMESPPAHSLQTIGENEDVSGGVHLRTDSIIPNPSGRVGVGEVVNGLIGGSRAGIGLGYRMAEGDFNGDGETDLAISAIFDSTLSQEGGAVYLFMGPLPPGGFNVNTTAADLTIYGGIDGGRIGESLLFEDLDGDGREELVIGAPTTIYPLSLWTTVAGAVYIVKGDEPGVYGNRIDLPSRPRASGSMYDVELFMGGAVICIWGLGPQQNVRTGEDLSSGDLNGDGIGDLVFSQPVSSHVFVLWGNATWPPTGILTVNSTESDFGRSVLLTDVDSDGVDDLLVGCPLYSTPALDEAGAIFLFYGDSNLTTVSNLNQTRANVTIEGASSGMHLGEDLSRLSVSDGLYDTIAVSAPGDEYQGEAVGSVYLIRGRGRGYFEREQSVSTLYFLRIVGDDPEAPFKEIKSYDADRDGRDELLLLRPVKKVNGEIRGELAMVYSSSIYGSGSRDRLISSMETYTIYGEELHDAFGCDSVILGDQLYVGAYGADGVDNSLTNSGSVYLIAVSQLRIRQVRLQGLFERDGVLYAAPYRDFTMAMTFYSSTGVENITGAVLNFSESEGWNDYVKVFWNLSGGVQKVRDPWGLLDVGVRGEVQTTSREITLTLRMWLSYLWPTRGNLSADVVLLGGGGGVVEMGALKLRLLKELKWEFNTVYAYSGARNVSMDGIFLLPSSPLTFRGPSVVYKEMEGVPVDLRYFRAVLNVPGEEPVTSSLQGGFSFTTTAPKDPSPPGGYIYSVEVVWIGPAPPPGAGELSLPPMPPPLMRVLRVGGTPPPSPTGVSIEGDVGGGNVAYSRMGDFTLSWSENWLEPVDNGLPVSTVKVTARGSAQTVELTPGEPGGFSAIFYNSSDFSGRRLYLKEVALPARWGVLGPDPQIIEPEAFSGIFYGSLYAGETGTFTVGLAADTLAILDLDGKTLLVSGEGVKKTVMISLNRGLHPVRIWYLHRDAGECFVDLYFYPSYRPEEPADPEVEMHPPTETELELEPGTWEVTLQGVDLLGTGGNSSAVTAVVDRTPPGIVRLPGPAWYTARPLTLQFEVTDGDAGVDIDSLQWSMSLNGVDWGEYSSSGLEVVDEEAGGRRYIVNLSLSLPDGDKNYVRLRVKDRVGNGYTHTGPLQVKVDTLPPGVDITSPANGEVVRTSSITLTATLSDTLSGLDPSTVEIYVEGEGWRGVGVDFSPGEKETEVSLPLSLKEGNNTFRIAVSDMAGNRVESPPLVVVRASEQENRPPVAVIDSPKNGSRYQQGYTILFDGSSSYDDGVGPYRGLKFLWTSNISGVLGEGAVIERSLPAGHHLITLYVDDGEFNSSAQVEIEVVVPPQIKQPPQPTPSGGGGLSNIQMGILILAGVVALILTVWLYYRYQTTPGEQAVIPIGPEEE